MWPSGLEGDTESGDLRPIIIKKKQVSVRMPCITSQNQGGHAPLDQMTAFYPAESLTGEK